MRNGCATLTICALLLHAPAHAASQLRYVLLSSDGKQAGEEIVSPRPDGGTSVHFVFKDNSFGPELDEEYRLAADGTFMEYRSHGVSDYGAPVSERFARAGNHATWASSSEHGESSIAGPALYVPLNGSNEFASVSIAALARRPPVGTCRCCLPGSWCSARSRKSACAMAMQSAVCS